jgi:hypothetical protein
MDWKKLFGCIEIFETRELFDHIKSLLVFKHSKADPYLAHQFQIDICVYQC